MEDQAHHYRLSARFNWSKVRPTAGSRSSSASLRTASSTPSSASESTAGNESSSRQANVARYALGSLIASCSTSLNVCML